MDDLMKKENKPDSTALSPLQPEKPAEETKLKHLTDEEIIQGFRYLMNKDRKNN